MSALRSELERDAARHSGRLCRILREQITLVMLKPFEIEPVGSVATLPAPRRVTDEEIARRAFEIYCERSRHDGRDVDDWLRAESECHARRAFEASFQLRVKADRRVRRGPWPGVERRRLKTT
jgi:DUF2934 family protein